MVCCCRSYHIKENEILARVEGLIEKHDASVNIPAIYYGSGTKKKHNMLPDTVVVVARFILSVLKCLLNADPSSVTIRETSRLKLLRNPKKSANGTYLTALQLAKRMKAEELENGATESQMKLLN